MRSQPQDWDSLELAASEALENGDLTTTLSLLDDMCWSLQIETSQVVGTLNLLQAACDLLRHQYESFKPSEEKT